jgi:probable phosphoglycerate mutase
MTPEGREQARRLRGPLMAVLRTRTDPVVFTSPLQRATETAQIALAEHPADETHLLRELDYGDYEGMSAEEIRDRVAGWNLFADGTPGGESLPAVSARCDSFIAKLERVAAGRNVVAFTHGHFSRILTMRLLGLPIASAALLHNDTASIALLDHRRDRLVLTGWNIGATG